MNSNWWTLLDNVIGLLLPKVYNTKWTFIYPSVRDPVEYLYVDWLLGENVTGLVYSPLSFSSPLFLGVAGLTSLSAWLLLRDWLPVPSVFCRFFVFVNGLIMFYMFVSSTLANVSNGIHWSCRSHDRKWPGKQKLGRVETNYSLGIGKAKLSLGRLN